MRKFFSIKGKQSAIGIIIAVFAIFAAWYYLVYIPEKEKDLYEQHFRWLQKTDSNIRVKIDAIDSSLLNQLTLLTGLSKDTDKDTFINQSSNEDGTLSYQVKPSKGVKKNHTGSYNLPRPEFSLHSDSAMSHLVISAVLKKPEDTTEVSISYDFGHFFKPVLETATFDHYVIFYNGKYVYEDFHSGLGYDMKNEDSLLATGRWVTGANIIDQKVGGVMYKVFLQPVNFFSSGKLIIAGLHSQKRFDAEKKQLPANVVLLSIILALAVLLLFPWIRLYFIGKNDRLTLGDATESMLVAKLLMSLLILFFFKYNFSLSRQSTRPSEVLGNEITHAFRDEIDSAYSHVVQFDSIMNSKNLFNNFINLGKTNIAGKPTAESGSHSDKIYIADTVLNLLNNLYASFPLTEINWMDSSGQIRYNWTTSGRNSLYGHYEDRNYFKDIFRNKTIKPYTDSPDAFTIEQVISRTNGDFKTVICKKSVLATGSKDKSVAVVLMDWNMKSLDSVIMPEGYSFAIIDNNGEVKYHSDQRKNLNENLLDEFSAKRELQDAIQGGFTERFRTDYYGSSYYVRVGPVRGFPYFIVVMSDRDYADGMNIETFAFSWGMILFFLIVAVADLAILIMSSSRRSLFRKQSVVTSWLWPRRSSADEYFIAASGNCIMIFLLCASLHLFSYLCRSFLLLFCIPMLTIFFNTIFLHKYKAKEFSHYRSYKVKGAWFSAGFLLLLNIIAYTSLGSSYLSILVFEIILMTTGFLLIYLYNKLAKNKGTQWIKSKSGYLYSFTFMAFTKLLVTSAIPVYFFYTASYNFQRNIMARNRQYDYVKQLKNKFPGDAALNAAVYKQKSSGINYRAAIYTDCTWISSVTISDNPGSIPKPDKTLPEERNTAELFNNFSSWVGLNSDNANDNFYRSSPDDSTYWFNNLFKDVLSNNEMGKLFMPLGSKGENSGNADTSKKWLVVQTANLNYPFPYPSTFSGFEFWFLLSGILLIFYFILTDIVSKVCSLDTREVSTWKGMQSYPGKLFSPGISLWIVGAEPSATFEELYAGFSQQRKDLEFDRMKCVLDFEYAEASSETAKPDIELYNLVGGDLIMGSNADTKQSGWGLMKATVFESKNPFVFLLNIESRPGNEKITGAKLSCIQALIQKNKHIIIVSAVHPFYLQEIMTGENNKSMQKDLIRLNNIVSNLPVIIRPLITIGGGETDSDVAVIENEKTKRLLKAEYRYTGFLHDLHHDFPLPDSRIEHPERETEDDLLVLKIQSLSYNYYNGIWQTLSTDEKFILYDLSEDGLVNIRNRFAFNLLINKGLVLATEGHPRIFNRSFRNFIVSAISTEGLADIEQMRRKGSGWSKLKTPLLILVVAIFIFLSVSQQGAYTTLIAVLSSVTAGIPILLKLFSMLGVQSERQPKNITAKESE